MPNSTGQVSSSRLMNTVQHLDSLGIRFAGTEGEKKAAKWIYRKFEELGLSRVEEQEFPCLSFSYSHCSLEVGKGRDRKKINSEPAAHSPSTPAEGLEGPLVFVEKIPDRLADCKKLFSGRIALLLNSEFFEFNRFKRVMLAKPAALLLVDDRFPNDWTVAIGFPRYWVDYISCPMANLSHLDAWNLVRGGVSNLRLRIETTISDALSQNIIGEVKGKKKPLEVIVISAHHDSVINNPGADDNCTGVAAVLELARHFAQRPAGRTLRFISYGTEEQLSEGARHYAANCKDLSNIRFVLNIDSIGAWMGKTGLYYAGPKELADFLREVNQELDFPGHLIKELSPFSDHFPLNFAGIPAVWYYRTTYVAARHYHHSRLETPEVVSPEVMAGTVRQQAGVLDRLGNSATMPFARSIPKSQMQRLRQMARLWCGIDPAA